jgi:hypothetical protein
MRRQCLVIVLLLCTPAMVLAQRYGRPYTLAESPQLLLEIRVEKSHRYFRVADLRKMPRVVVTETDPVTKQKHVYEGVALGQLLSNTALGGPGESIEIDFGKRQMLMLAGTDLDTQGKAIVADTVDGRALTGEAPYYLVVKVRNKAEQAIPNVQCITVRERSKEAMR